MHVDVYKCDRAHLIFVMAGGGAPAACGGCADFLEAAQTIAGDPTVTVTGIVIAPTFGSKPFTYLGETYLTIRTNEGGR